MNINGFEFPDPDHIGQAEYRAIHDLIAEVIEEEHETDDLVAAAIGALIEVEYWCNDLKDKLWLVKGGK